MQEIAQVSDAAVTVGVFLEHARRRFPVEMASGRAGIDRRIIEPALNRPAFALAGFYSYFAHRRIQVFGAAEQAYLGSLTAADRAVALETFFKRQIPCLVVARNRRLAADIRDLSEAHGIPVLRSPMVTGAFVNAATAVMEQLTARRVKVQGTMLEILGVGVLIDGRPGVGKSETALALVERGHALVADDVTLLRQDSQGDIIAASVDVTRYHMEIRGIGIIHVPSLFGVSAVRGEKKLDLVISLVPAEELSPEAVWETQSKTRVLGEELPHITLPVAPGRDLANLVEAAARDLKLRMLGHDAAKELDERLITRLTGGG